MSSPVLVAYCEQDRAYASEVIRYLRDRGVDLVDNDGAEGEAHALAVRSCRALVLLATDDSVQPESPARRLAELAMSVGRDVVTAVRTRQPIDWLDRRFLVVGRTRNIIQKELLKVLSSRGLVRNATDTSMFDITNRLDVVRYVIRSQLYLIGASPADVAGNDVDADELTAFLENDDGALTPETLRLLDDAVKVIGHAKGLDQVGGLAQFAVRLLDPVGASADNTRLRPDWANEMLRGDTDSEVHVLVQASVLINEFAVADKVNIPSSAIRAKYRTTITQVVDRLILMASALQNARYIEAQLLLAGLAQYAFETVKDRLMVSLQSSPLGFRAWRSVARLLAVASSLEKRNNPSDQALIRDVKVWIRGLVNQAPMLRKKSIFPARALDLECFVAIPWEWGLRTDGDVTTDVVTKALAERAKDSRATLRERGTAALGIWQRAVENGKMDDPEVVQELQRLVKIFREADEPDLASGLRWIAATLTKVMDDRTPVCVSLPTSDEEWYKIVARAAGQVGDGWPPEILVPTQELFQQAILHNGNVERRRAIDALRAGGLVDPVAQQLNLLINNRQLDGWVRIRALFCLGFLQARTASAEDLLVTSCQRSANGIKVSPDRIHAAEMHEALFAVADIFGVTGIEDAAAIARAGAVRNRLSDVLDELITFMVEREDPGLNLVGRAIAYLLMFTAQAGLDDLSRRMLERLRDHPDEVTANFASWALRFRWAPGGELRPLLNGIR